MKLFGAYLEIVVIFLLIAIFYLFFKTFQKPDQKEGYEITDTYIDAVERLGEVAKTLATSGNLTIPGNLTVQGVTYSKGMVVGKKPATGTTIGEQGGILLNGLPLTYDATKKIFHVPAPIDVNFALTDRASTEPSMFVRNIVSTSIPKEGNSRDPHAWGARDYALKVTEDARVPDESTVTLVFRKPSNPTTSAIKHSNQMWNAHKTNPEVRDHKAKGHAFFHDGLWWGGWHNTDKKLEAYDS